MAYGSVDESNAALGIALSFQLDEDISKILNQIQNELFIVGADLSNPDLTNEKNRVTQQMTLKLEELIDKFENELPILNNFILPGGDSAASQIHYARTVIRRAETHLVQLMESEKINHECVKYLNRLSDFLFVMARLVNKRKGREDILWKI